jgi:hypothetical protein
VLTAVHMETVVDFDACLENLELYESVLETVHGIESVLL